MKQKENYQIHAEDFASFKQINFQDGRMSPNDSREANTSLDMDRLSPIQQQECFDGGLLQAIESKLLPSDLLSSEDEQEKEDMNTNTPPRTGSSTHHSDSMTDSFEALSGSNNDMCPSGILSIERQSSSSSIEQVKDENDQISIRHQKNQFEQIPEMGGEQSLICGVNSIFSQDNYFTPFQLKETGDLTYRSFAPANTFNLPVFQYNVTPFAPQLVNQEADVPKNPENTEQQKTIQNSQKQKNKNCQYQFPEGGWECSRCHNYNFKGRKECKRCKKPKTVMDQTGIPEHINLDSQDKAAMKKQKTKQKRQQKVQDIREAKALLAKQEQLAQEYPQLKQLSLKELTQQIKSQKKNQENFWDCQRCFNRNFAFRNECNRCKFSIQENDAILMKKDCQNMPMPIYTAQNQQATI